MAAKKRKSVVKSKLKSAKRVRRSALDPDAMMAAWQKAATPADGHKRLEPMVGSFRTKNTFVMLPGAPAAKSEGTSEHRWVLGNRYLEQRYSGMAMDMPMEGIGFTGYDNVQRKYVGTWMDTFGTGLMNSVGVGRPSNKTMDFEAEFFEPFGKRKKFWCKIRIRDNNRHSYEMWTKAPNGKKFRTMLIEYTRV